MEIPKEDVFELFKMLLTRNSIKIFWVFKNAFNKKTSFRRSFWAFKMLLTRKFHKEDTFELLKMYLTRKSIQNKFLSFQKRFSWENFIQKILLSFLKTLFNKKLHKENIFFISDSLGFIHPEPSQKIPKQQDVQGY